MSDQRTTGELYAAAARSTSKIVAGIRPEQWANATPCTEWDLRVLVNHVTYENLWAAELFAGKTMKEVGSRFEGDVLGADPLGAHAASVEPAARAATAPGAMEALCEISMGPTTGSEYAAQMFLDLLIHGWDIAKGSGQDARMDPALVEACMPIAIRITGFVREKGWAAYVTEVEPAGDDPQTRLLAIMGRRADLAAPA
jgi:uncharacterized protein (TIGR03086 family)